MSKIPQYTRNAINRYNSKFDRLTINLPRGTKDRIIAQSESVNSYIVQAVLERLEADENDETRRQAAPESQETAKTNTAEESHLKQPKRKEEAPVSIEELQKILDDKIRANNNHKSQDPDMKKLAADVLASIPTPEEAENSAKTEPNDPLNAKLDELRKEIAEKKLQGVKEF